MLSTNPSEASSDGVFHGPKQATVYNIWRAMRGNNPEYRRKR